ncbi:MAG: hypothetical protein HYY16_02715 [Planctomycetes bacterium]|nr:hypothetical protein [Planctomycetota bacterium]
MADTRYHELLQLSEEVSDPDYYQLLELERVVIDEDLVEERFKRQMVKLQAIQSPKHKEFIEFLKGELKKARVTLTDPERRRKYDQELQDERIAQLRKLCSHMLVDGTLSQQGEISLVEEGKRIGIDPGDIRRAIDEEMARAGAQRVAAKRTDTATQAASNSMLRELALQLDEARIAARFAEAKARHAEQAKERAEEEALRAVRRAKEVQVLVHQTAQREAVAQEEEREQLESEVRRLQTLLDEREKEIGGLREQLEMQGRLSARAEEERSRRAGDLRASGSLAWAHLTWIVALLAGYATRTWVPGAEGRVDAVSARLSSVRLDLLAAVVGGVVVTLWVACLILARRRGRKLFVWVTAMMAVLLFGFAAVYLRLRG